MGRFTRLAYGPLAGGLDALYGHSGWCRSYIISMALIHKLVGLAPLPAAYERRLVGEQDEIVRQAFWYWRGATPASQLQWEPMLRFLAGAGALPHPRLRRVCFRDPLEDRV